MKVKRFDTPFPAISIDDFIPSAAIVRAAAESLEEVNNWVITSFRLYSNTF